jgi:hypothetical protein
MEDSGQRAQDPESANDQEMKEEASGVDSENCKRIKDKLA